MINLDEWQKEILNTKGSIILCSGRQVGKSTIIAHRDGERAAKNPNESILIVSKTERQAELLFLKVLLYIEDNYKYLIAKGKDKPTKHMLKLKNGSIIRCLPTGEAGEGIRGFTLTKLTIDEAPLVDERVYNAVIPSLLTKGTDMDLLGTPHGAIGFFYECYKNADKLFNVFHVNSEEVMNNRKISQSWTEKDKENALKHLEQAKRLMSAREYAQEYMGEFIPEFSQFFSDELIRKCMTQKRRPIFARNRTYFLGVDIARMGDDESTFEIIDRTSKDMLFHVDSIITTKTKLNETADKIIELDKRYQFRNIYIDTGGIGIAVFDWLLAHEQTKRKIVPINNRDMPLDRDEVKKKRLLKEDLYNNLLMLMERGMIQLLDDDEVFMSLKSVQYEYTTAPNTLTKLRIFGNYTHIAEGLIRSAWCVKDKSLNIWVR